MTNWQPIETAPKNGTWIRFREKPGQRASNECYWDDYTEEWVSDEYAHFDDDLLMVVDPVEWAPVDSRTQPPKEGE